MTGQELRQLESAFRTTTETTLQSNIILYLKGLREQKFNRLLQEDVNRTDSERNIIVGELRLIQKLMNVLEPRSNDLLDFE